MQSSLVLRYCQDEFARQYYPTVGVDVFLKRTLVDNQSVRLVIWDVSGNSMTSALLDNYLYTAQVDNIIFDFIYDLYHVEKCQLLKSPRIYLKQNFRIPPNGY